MALFPRRVLGQVRLARGDVNDRRQRRKVARFSVMCDEEARTFCEAERRGRKKTKEAAVAERKDKRGRLGG